MRHCLCLDSAHIPGLKDMVLGVISVCFSTRFGRLVFLQAVGTAVFLCPGDQRGLMRMGKISLGDPSCLMCIKSDFTM